MSGAAGSAVTLGGGTLTVNSSDGVNAVNSTFSGVIGGVSDNGSLVKKGLGTLTLNGSSAQAYTGPTMVLGGTLALDFANMAAPANMLSAAAPLTLGGGTLRMIGKSNTTNSQTFAGTTLSAGDSAVEAAGAGGATTSIVLGAISRRSAAPRSISTSPPRAARS